MPPDVQIRTAPCPCYRIVKPLTQRGYDVLGGERTVGKGEAKRLAESLKRLGLSLVNGRGKPL